MTEQKLKSLFAIGVTVAVEIKRCGTGIESDTYEISCSLLNRFGGDIYLGVEDYDTVREQDSLSCQVNGVGCGYKHIAYQI